MWIFIIIVIYFVTFREIYNFLVFSSSNNCDNLSIDRIRSSLVRSRCVRSISRWVGLWIINSQCQFSRHFLIQFMIDIEMVKKVRGSEIAAAVSESISCSSSCMCHPSHCKVNKNFPSITEDGKTWFSSCYIGAIVVSPNLSKICNEHSTVKLFFYYFP